MCFICGRGNCCPSFHSLDEQAIFEPASEAYDKFLDIREQCARDLAEQEEEDEEEVEEE